MAENEKKAGQEDVSLLDGTLLTKMATGGAAELRANADAVNNLNVFPVPDGDTGDNMCMTIESGVAALQDLETDDLATVMSALSHGMLLGARGNSGVILSQFFSGMANGLASCAKADVMTLGQALSEGVKKAYEAVMTPTEGTILTVAREAVAYAVANLSAESTVNTLFSDLMKEMYASLQRTPELLAVLKEAHVVDSGGAGLLYIIEGFNKALNGEELSLPTLLTPQKHTQGDFSSFTADSVMEYGYCTELLLQLQNSKVDAEAFDVGVITAYLQTVGDSVVSFKTGTIVKIHVHTMTPEAVLGFCRQYGEFLTVKIENMSVQHSENTQIKEEATPAKKYGMVAVCSGEGLRNTLTELGVDVVVSGGQTNNPSTSDFLEAFEQIHAEHIFVFPNNGNIILAAKQAASIYEKATVHVMESKDFGAGYVGILSFDMENDDATALETSINAAMQSVSTGYVSPAVRDADMNGVHITDGEFIGYVGKEIITSKKDANEAAIALAEKLLKDGEKCLLTVFSGKDTADEETLALENALLAAYPEVEFYFVSGGQDIHLYIIVAE
ncbi:MAG: DAK2 domain-containing protein [Clostridia bacterium]|nr:DAK2 domain-containing protein [Clostridia bacterium]